MIIYIILLVVLLIIGIVFLFRCLNFRRVIKLFKDKSVIVFGSRGSGKDLLFSNVVAYRKSNYCSNMNYLQGKKKAPIRYPFHPVYIKLGGNTFKNFADNNLIPYSYPLPDKVDYYISDAGVYFPSHEDDALNKRYPEVPMFQALVRHLGDSNFHCNIQALDRLWKKIREQAECYIYCVKSKVSRRGVVSQTVIVYDRYDTALKMVEPLVIRKPLLGKQVKTDIVLTRANFRAQYGNVTKLKLIYKNKANYDSRMFKKILETGSSEDLQVSNVVRL